MTSGKQKQARDQIPRLNAPWDNIPILFKVSRGNREIWYVSVLMTDHLLIICTRTHWDEGTQEKGSVCFHTFLKGGDILEICANSAWWEHLGWVLLPIITWDGILLPVWFKCHGLRPMTIWRTYLRSDGQRKRGWIYFMDSLPRITNQLPLGSLFEGTKWNQSV